MRFWGWFCLIPALSFGAVPAQEWAVNGSGAWGAEVGRRGLPDQSQSAYTGDATWINRQPIHGDWFWNWGARAEGYGFERTTHLPVKHLQDYAGRFGVEYFIGDTAALSLTIRPGFYFENKLTFNSWDIPVDFVSGIPITANFAGVVGISHARFLVQPVPVFGVYWKATSKLAIQAVYPEPAITYQVNPQWEAALVGDLVGGGFKTDSIPGRDILQYYAYRIGPQLTHKTPSGLQLGISTGYEMRRRFSFFQYVEHLDANGAWYLQLTLRGLR